MAKKKAELLEEAKKLGLEVTEKNTIAEINALIAGMSQTPVDPIEKGDTEIAQKGEEIQQEEAKEEGKLAKAGKRSAKGIKEAEEKVEKIERQKSGEAKDEAPAKPKKIVKPARSRLERRAKGYRKSTELIDKSKEYSLKEALELAPKTSHVKFDATVELHVRLNVDPKQADQNIRDSVVLPAGSGKTVTVATVSEDDESILAKLDKEQIDFDVLIATPSVMPKLAKYARLLGPKGLMPNPKSGTVTTDLKKAAEQAKSGKIEYRVDSTGIIHVAIGKVGFGAEKLNGNARAVLDSIKQNKPASVKGIYVQSISATTSMGPSIKITNSEL